jgi:hypothetical protein
MHLIGDLAFDWSEQLWRYFKVNRFIATTESSSLYFAAARQFDDKFEGAVAVIPPEYKRDPRYAESDHLDCAFEQLKRLTKISCWHRAFYESNAMWKLYAGMHKGVAICTTPERLRDAAVPFRLKPDYGIEGLNAGNVQYVDLLEVRMNVGMLERFFCKHMAFSWECEFRMAISLRMAEECGVHVPEQGINVRFDLNKLIDKIVLGPSLSPEEIEAVAKNAANHGLERRIVTSSLLGTPRYA